MNFHFIAGDGKQYGPHSAEQMRQYMGQNRLTGKSQVSADGGPWQPASSYPELAVGDASAPASGMVGATLPTTPKPAQGASTNGMAITGMVCGILTILPSCCCGLFGLPLTILLVILSIVFSIIGLVQIKKNPAQKGKGMAIAGLIIGALGLIAAILMVVVFAMTGALS